MLGCVSVIAVSISIINVINPNVSPRMNVRLADGQEGTINPAEFDKNTMSIVPAPPPAIAQLSGPRQIPQPLEPQTKKLLFREGDSKADVYLLQGTPDRMETIHGEDWIFYGNSYVQFDSNEKVKHCYNTGDLKYEK